MEQENNGVRCAWETHDPEYIRYHDEQWGRPELDSQVLFAKLCLDGQQAGLSWITILKKQKHYEDAFFNFDPKRIVTLGDKDVERLMLNPGIIRNRLKIKSIISNAHAYLAISRERTFSDFIWQFTQYKTIVNSWQDPSEVPVSTPESVAMAKALKKAGFKFVGDTICYAFMQACGLVNDHLTHCRCYDEVSKLARR
ncbi:DNA-3-methyladenine glycosylase I [Alteromonas sp. C1M14]|uniref:DNA-3-methyladenine glycosylase I n=1 Tax=Alteromonas sp. C1M14 TaxID=2841567 RepID=UPI001C08C929|nr:DNA-3-methyladenine glycosylase I [Alteromonas sp. C1M14]MBU2978453.1 DNA-3-methyladenine glycosylase I [Alteromonas sp. C1M14]